MTDPWRDIRYAARVLIRARGFSFLAVSILGIGIGASTTIFSALNGVLLQPLPYTAPHRLVSVWESNRAEDVLRSGMSPAMLVAIRDDGRAFSGIAAYRAWGYELGGGEPERLRGARVSANLFTLLGVPALVGRRFSAGDDAPGAAPVALLSEELWRRRFGGDRAVVGTALELNGQPHTVVGIVPAGFVLPEAEVWAPLVFAPYELDQPGNRALSIVARLLPGVRLSAARAEVSAVVRRRQVEFPAAHAGWEVVLEDLHRDLAGGARAPLVILFTAMCMVLLAACATLASLVLARSASRRREIALRAALGSGRWRIVRQLVTESMLIVAAASVLGLALAQAGNGAMIAVAGSWLPRGARIAIDPIVLAFMVVITLVAGAALAAIPAVDATRVDLQHAIKTAPDGAPRRGVGLRDATAVAQVALGLVLLVGGGLLVRSFFHAQRVDTGFAARDVVAMTMSLPARYDSPEQRAGFFATLEARVAALPGVRAAGLASHLPLAGGLLVSDFEIEGRPAADPGAMTAHLVNVTPGYFETLRVPLLAGRGFTPDDQLGRTPVVVIDAELARRHWPGGGAVGRRVRLGVTLGADPAWREVVGVAGSVRAVSLERAAEPTIYIPHAQNPWPSLSLVIGAARSPEEITRAAVDEVHALDPSRPVYGIRSVDEAVTRLLAPRRLQTLLMGGFAAAALALAVIGVYGMLAHTIVQRTRELGVRMALGARRREIVWLCLRRGLVRIGLGLGLGVAGALAGTRLLAGVLFGLGPWDPLTYAGALLVLLVAGVAASAGPALRAARLDPMAALRQE